MKYDDEDPFELVASLFVNLHNLESLSELLESFKNPEMDNDDTQDIFGYIEMATLDQIKIAGRCLVKDELLRIEFHTYFRYYYSGVYNSFGYEKNEKVLLVYKYLNEIYKNHSQDTDRNALGDVYVHKGVIV